MNVLDMFSLKGKVALATGGAGLYGRQIVEALALHGCGRDPRLANALEFIRSRQDAQGRWALEYDYADKTWLDAGPKKAPNPWVTLRALRALKAAAQ